MVGGTAIEFFVRLDRYNIIYDAQVSSSLSKYDCVRMVSERLLYEYNIKRCAPSLGSPRENWLNNLCLFAFVIKSRPSWKRNICSLGQVALCTLLPKVKRQLDYACLCA